MLTCSKRYTDIPFAHRAPDHDGHCKLIHGHSWEIEVVFGAHSLDENGFVVDFGKLKFLKEYLDRNFDHAFVVAESDPELPTFEALQSRGLCKLCVVADTSAEGLARHFYDRFHEYIRDVTNYRAFVFSVTVSEDSRNKATYRPVLALESVPV